MLEKQPSWENYENYTIKIMSDEVVLNYLEKHFKLFNLKIKPKKKIPGKKTGTEWQIDGYGDDINNHRVLIECKHYSTRSIEQNTVAAFAYIIQDVGANSGIIVTTFGLQEGAIKVAETENIGLIKLDYNSTDKNFVVRFASLNKLTLENPGEIVATFTDQMNGTSFVATKGKITKYPIPTYKQLLKAKEKLNKRTKKTHFSDAEIFEEIEKMQDEEKA